MKRFWRKIEQSGKKTSNLHKKAENTLLKKHSILTLKPVFDMIVQN